MTADASTQLHGGRLVAQRLRAHGVTKVFTLSGGHLFSIYDGCRAEGIDLIDVRHEQSAAFAAEGWAKVTRSVGVCALTAGPGVTNGMSAIASASQNHSPMLVLGGRAPQFRWGQGSLQEIDHVPFVRPLVKLAATSDSTADIPGLVDEALKAAITPHFGPAFVDFPLDHVFMEAGEPAPAPKLPEHWRGPAAPDGRALDRAGALLREAERPVIMAGTGLYWGRGEDALRALAQELQIPVFLNGLGRGCLPADHELFFARARSVALGEADVALVIGVPLDFRLGFGAAFSADAEIIVIDAAEPEREHPRVIAAELYGALPATLDALRSASAGVGAGGPRRGGSSTGGPRPGGPGSGGSGAGGPRPGGPSTGGSGAGGASAGARTFERAAWIASLRAVEDEKRAGEGVELSDSRAPLHPMRIYGELAQLLDRDAIIVGDGGDFVSFAGRVVDSYQPGCWLDPGPFGCLGSGPGYALAAKLAHPDRQVVLLLGDGAFGFAGMEFDTLARHEIPVVAVIGNNGIWALEKHPMEALYGYSVVAELRPQTRYDQIAEALGCHGELVREPGELRPALDRALSSGKPALVNVLTDPSVAYPRRSNLA